MSGKKDVGKIQMKPMPFGVFCAVILTLAFCACANAEQITIDADQQFSFAEELFKQGQYRHAAEEFLRFIYFFPNTVSYRSALLMAGKAFYEAQEIPSALTQFELLMQNAELDPLAVEAFFMTADCYLKQGAAGQAILTLLNLSTLSKDDAVHDRSMARIARIRIDQLDWPAADSALQKISMEGRRRYPVDAIQSALAQADQIPQKNPQLAGILSVLPGAGQLYCGRYEDALAAFLVNSGLIFSSIEAFDRDLNALGALLAFVEIGFYTGNIYGAVAGAHKYNRDQRHRFADRLNQTWSMHLTPLSKGFLNGAMISMRIKF